GRAVMRLACTRQQLRPPIITRVEPTFAPALVTSRPISATAQSCPRYGISHHSMFDSLSLQCPSFAVVYARTASRELPGGNLADMAAQYTVSSINPSASNRV